MVETSFNKGVKKTLRGEPADMQMFKQTALRFLTVGLNRRLVVFRAHERFTAVTGTVVFCCFPSTLKHKADVFKFLRLEERLSKSSACLRD